MNDKAAKIAIADALRSKDFEVILLEESDKPTADLLAFDKECTLLIEIKERYGSEFQAIRDRHPKTSFEVKTDKISRQNRLSGISRKAVEQLSSSQDQEIVKLIWLIADPYNKYLHYEQFRATVYGIKLVVYKDKEHGLIKEGFYVENSEFYRWRAHLDGVALGNFEGLFMNNYSLRYSKLRDTRFRHLFGQSVWDPPVLEKLGKAFCLDSNIDRKDKSSVKRALEEKYHIEVISFESFVRFSI